MNKKIIILTLSLVLIIVLYTFLYSSNHKKILEERLEVDLPQSTEIIKYSNDAIFKAGVCAAKISITDSDYDDFIAQLNKNCLRDDLEHKPREENIINWWDLDKNDIEFWYSDCLSPNHFIFGLSKPKTAGQDIYITYSANGKRTIYLVYVE